MKENLPVGRWLGVFFPICLLDLEQMSELSTIALGRIKHDTLWSLNFPSLWVG